MSAFLEKGFGFFDGILSLIINTKEISKNRKVYKLQIVGKAKISFCLEVNGIFSHGDTLREAKDSFIYKIGERDKSAYSKWGLSTKITKRKAIESYRVITGACEYGCRCFVESIGKIKAKYTVKEIIELTEGQYGNEVYKSFFIKGDE